MDLEALVFDPIMDHNSDFLQNPYPQMEKLRQKSNVVWSPRGNHWLVTGMDEAHQLLRNNDLGKRLDKWKHPNLVARFFIKLLGNAGIQNILRQDPPEHTRVRGLMSSAFVPSVIHKLEPEIQNIADRLIDNFPKDGQVELVSQFAFPLPITVIAELLGVPHEDRDKFKNWSTQITTSLQGNVCPMKVAKSFGANNELRRYLKKIVAQKIKAPKNDLLSTLAQVSSQDQDKLSENELISNSVLILIAGHETTVNLIGNGVYNLLQNPEQLQQLRDNPALIENAVEEILRFDPPVQMVRRVAKKDMTIGDKSIKTDDVLTFLIGACNRDPESRLNNGDLSQFDIHRQNIKHISFGAGVHYCLGAELARTEARIAISTLLKRLPQMALAQPSMPYKGPFALRGLAQLNVRY